MEARTAALKQVVHHLEGFAYTVSHDLRAPLRAIKGMTHALREDYAHLYDEQGKDYAQHIIEAVERMEHLIAALLAYSRVGRGEIPVVAIELEEYVAGLRKHWAPNWKPMARIWKSRDTCPRLSLIRPCWTRC